LDTGLGGVVPTEKNIPLESPVAEKITAVYHENGQDIWVISHKLNNNEFIAYLITATGIQTTPVVTSVGENNLGGPNGFGALGYLKASPDGTKLASAISFYFTGLELFDFNKSTGEVSNALKIHSDQT